MDRGLLLDLYGTLVPGDGAAARDESSRRIANVLGVDPERFAAEMRASQRDRFTGDIGDLAESMRTLAERIGRPPSAAAVASAVRQRLSLARGLLQPGAGVLAALDELRAAGWRLALVTNCSAETPTVWPETPMAKRFDAAVFSSRIGAAKPDPRTYLAGVVALDLPPEWCAFAGDGSDGELPGARAFGLATVRVTGLADPAATPTWDGPQVASLAELPALLPSLLTDQPE